VGLFPVHHYLRCFAIEFQRAEQCQTRSNRRAIPALHGRLGQIPAGTPSTPACVCANANRIKVSTLPLFPPLHVFVAVDRAVVHPPRGTSARRILRDQSTGIKARDRARTGLDIKIPEPACLYANRRKRVTIPNLSQLTLRISQAPLVFLCVDRL